MNDTSTPHLTIEVAGGKCLGNCYNATYYKIKSLNRPLADADVKALRDLGFLGYGQEFSFQRVQEEEYDAYNKFYVITVESCVDSSD